MANNIITWVFRLSQWAALLGGALLCMIILILVFDEVAPIINHFKQFIYSTFANYSISIIPLFLLMGQFAALSGLSQALIKAAEA